MSSSESPWDPPPAPTSSPALVGLIGIAVLNDRCFLCAQHVLHVNLSLSLSLYIYECHLGAIRALYGLHMSVIWAPYEHYMGSV